jgi:hypothetical protein
MKINLSFTVEQVNLILASLGQRAYVEVAELIQKIKSEAEQQLVPSQPTEPTVPDTED